MANMKSVQNVEYFGGLGWLSGTGDYCFITHPSVTLSWYGDISKSNGQIYIILES